MPRTPSPAQILASQQNGKRSRGPSAPGATPKPALDSTKSGLRAQMFVLAHESILRSERCNQCHDYYNPQSPVAIHCTNECARASLLADRTDQYRQAELDKQVRQEEFRFNRKQRRRVRYLGVKLKTRPGEAVEQLQAFGQGVGFLSDAFNGLIDEVRTWGHLPPHVAVLGLQVCGCTPEPASVGRNDLAYTIQINNLGCTPGVPAAVIDAWLEPARRPAALRDRSRHALTGADPHECRQRLLAVLEAELDRLRDLAARVREEVDLPSLCEALNRASILTEESARRARSGAEARAMFHRASRELLKTLIQDREDGVGPLSSVLGPLSAGNDAGAEATPQAAVVEEPAPAVAAVEAGSQREAAGPAGAGRPLPGGPGAAAGSGPGGRTFHQGTRE